MKTTIKPTDLRTGNKLLFLGKIVTFKNITEIREDGIFWIKTFEPIIESKSFHFKPIELSEEVLLKCGFEYSESNNSWQLDSNLGFSFWGRTSKGFNCYCESEEFGETFYYLHQLQNLVYALTKEELTIKF